MNRYASAALDIEHLVWCRANECAARVLSRWARLADAFCDIDPLIGRTDERAAFRLGLRHGAAAKQKRHGAGR